MSNLLYELLRNFTISCRYYLSNSTDHLVVDEISANDNRMIRVFLATIYTVSRPNFKILKRRIPNVIDTLQINTLCICPTQAPAWQPLRWWQWPDRSQPPKQ